MVIDSRIKIDNKELEENPNSTKETNLTKEEMEKDTTDQNLDLVLTVEDMIDLVLDNMIPGDDAIDGVVAMSTMIGLPVLTGMLAILGAAPLVVISVAWLLPVGALILAPGIVRF